MPHFLLFFVVWRRSLKEEREVQRRFYTNPAFKACDQALLKSYRWNTPFRISKKFLKNRGEKEIHVYGETPLTTYERIGRECGLTWQDNVLELGCGRGRGVFFWAFQFGAKVTGVDWIPAFIGIARHIAKQIPHLRVSFNCEDFKFVDMNPFSVIYLFGTCLKEEEVRALIAKLKTLPLETRIVTISYPLTEYDPSFKLQKEFSVSFLWGETEAYIQTVG